MATTTGPTVTGPVRRPGHAHLEVAREAGFGRISFVSVLAGTLTAYGAFAVVAAIAGAILAAADVDFDYSTNDWSSEELAGAVVTAAVLLVAYLFGGYVAGRMARRSGLLNGIGVFVLSLIAGALAGGIVGGLADDADVEQNLRSIGVPTTGDDWSAVGITAAVLALAAMLVGAALGGKLGERWHTKLARRAVDPDYGPAADLRRRAEDEDERRDDRIAGDPVVDHDRGVVDVRDQDTYVEPRAF
jgi:hypothetical protein